MIEAVLYMSILHGSIYSFGGGNRKFLPIKRFARRTYQIVLGRVELDCLSDWISGGSKLLHKAANGPALIVKSADVTTSIFTC